MDRKSLINLKNGQTLYLVSEAHGMVVRMHVTDTKLIEGHPLVEGYVDVVMKMGFPISTVGEKPDHAAIWMHEDSATTAQNFMYTLSRKQAERWAKQGFAINRGVWDHHEGFQVRFKITPAGSETVVEPPLWTPEMHDKLEQLSSEL